MIRETESTSESDNLEVSAKRAWSLAVADFYHPPLPDPNTAIFMMLHPDLDILVFRTC